MRTNIQQSSAGSVTHSEQITEMPSDFYPAGGMQSDGKVFVYRMEVTEKS